MEIAEIAMNGSLYDFLFKQILGLSKCSGMGKYQFGCITGEFTHDFIFALFLPHIVILIFLFLFSDWGNLRRHHAGLSTLLGIGAYIFIIYIGWYPIIALWSIYWLGLGIALSFFSFLWTRIIHPTKTTELMKAAKGIGDSIGKSAAESKKLRLLLKRKRRLERLKKQSKHPRERARYAEKLEEVREKIEEMRGY